jgi:hypothetical protein
MNYLKIWEMTYHPVFLQKRKIYEHEPHHFIIDFGYYGVYEIVSAYVKTLPILPGSYESSFK